MVESQGCTVVAEGLRQTVLSPASDRKIIPALADFFFANAFAIGPIEWAIRDFAPCEKFLFTSD
ncbi:hypothetical protein QUB68_04705 [Microcoleus sp. A006_D1]|uniref:hypothetical protein n=1 Tax=Microcoleus sp. A006_D1 TaxID=3055267 RepID=UPI002FD74E43